MLYVTLCPFLYCNHLDGEEKAGCFALFVLIVSRDGWAALPRGAVGLSAVCDFGISWSYSLIFFIEFMLPLQCKNFVLVFFTFGTKFLPLLVGALSLVLFCYTVQYWVSYLVFAIILTKKRELVALLLLSSLCIVTVSDLWLFLTVPWIGLQCVIVKFPDHTQFLNQILLCLFFSLPIQ